MYLYSGYACIVSIRAFEKQKKKMMNNLLCESVLLVYIISFRGLT